MTLGEKQELFTSLFCTRLIPYAQRRWGVVVGEVERGEIQAEWNASHCRTCHGERLEHSLGTHRFQPIGLANSLHRDRLAGDLLLFKRTAGKRAYLKATADYAALGDYWKALDPLCRWGGDFPQPDGGHFSVSHRGRS